jgi:hypothetical protein
VPTRQLDCVRVFVDLRMQVKFHFPFPSGQHKPDPCVATLRVAADLLPTICQTAHFATEFASTRMAVGEVTAFSVL